MLKSETSEGNFIKDAHPVGRNSQKKRHNKPTFKWWKMSFKLLTACPYHKVKLFLLHTYKCATCASAAVQSVSADIVYFFSENKQHIFGF